jgi:hypothetical protein
MTAERPQIESVHGRNAEENIWNYNKVSNRSLGQITLKNFITYSLYHIVLGDIIKDAGVGKAYSTHGRNVRGI